MNARQFVLTKAREYIESGDYRYICFALVKVAQQHLQHAAACTAIQQEIDTGLAGKTGASLPHYVLEEMRRVTGEVNPEPYYSAWDHNTGLAVMMRLAWLDRLIEQEAE